MAVATMAIKQYTGSTPDKTTVTTPRLSTSDSANPGTGNPVPIPAADYYYSFWMCLALCITAMNDATLINNHKFYMDGACGWTMGTGGDLFIGIRDSGDNGCPEGSYDQATGTEGTTGHWMDDGTNGHTYYKDQTATPAAADTYTSGSPLTVDTQDMTEAGELDHIVVQVKVASDATRGAQTAETLTFQYDEV